MIRPPPRSTRMTHSVPTRRSSDLVLRGRTQYRLRPRAAPRPESALTTFRWPRGQPPRGENRGLSLAAGAPEGGSAAVRAPPHGRATGAGHAFPPVDAPFLAEIAKLAVGPGIVPEENGRAHV